MEIKKSTWQMQEDQKEIHNQIRKFQEEYAQKVAEYVKGIDSKHHQFAYYNANDIGYSVVMAFLKVMPPEIYKDNGNLL
jgi:gas vesicle protein